MSILNGLLNSGSLDALSGLFNSDWGLNSSGLGGPLGAAASLESGDISGLFQVMETVLGGSGGLTSLTPGRDHFAPAPRANVIFSSSALRGLPPAPAAQATAAAPNPGFRLDGYEYFDPATAGQIESEWEFFVPPSKSSGR